MHKRRAVLFPFLAIAAASLLCLAAAARADEILLTSGGRIQGDVISNDERQLVLQTAYGRVTFPAADISKVVYSTPVEKEIRSALSALATSDVAGRMKLAARASSEGFDELGKSIYAQVIAIEPDEKTARKALGYVFYEGEWVTSRDRDLHPGLVPYKGAWVKPADRDALRKTDAEHQYFAQFGLTAAQAERIQAGIADFDVSIEPRGGYIVRRHVRSYQVKDKPYFYSVDLLNWQRLGVFVGITFIDQTRHRTTGFGILECKIYSVKTDALGNNKADRELLSTTMPVMPEMWKKKSDFQYWDTKVSSTYEQIISDDARAAWSDNYYMNCDGILYVLANRDVCMLVPPGVFYVEATFTLNDKVKKTGRFVQYAELR